MDPLLQLLPELADLPEAHETLAAAARQRTVRPGALIMREGQGADCLIGVLAGEVDVLRRFGSADRLIARLGPGSLMGEAALVPGLARTATVRACDEVALLELPADAFRQVLLAHPALALSLLGTVMRRLQRRDEAYLKALHQGLLDRERELAVLRARQAPGEDPEEVWCPSLEPVLERARRLARSDLPVLISGESGTGKELLARYVHRHSGRAARAVHSLNCAAIPGEIAEAELFGVRKGAFTGATQDRPGLLKTADGGTLFLDEIGDLPLGQQAKLLRALQDGSFYPVGSQQPDHSDVRLVSATNKDLRGEVAAGQFREDLYYRIEGARLELPALRDRPDHVPLLMDWYLRRAVPEADPVYVSHEVRPLLLRYRWPGNVRELMSVLRAALALTSDFPRLRAADLPEQLLQGVGAEELGGRPGPGRALAPAGQPGGATLADLLAGRTLSAFQRDVTVDLLERALEEASGVRKDAAALLGITPQNLANYLRRLGLRPAGGRNPR